MTIAVYAGSAPLGFVGEINVFAFAHICDCLGLRIEPPCSLDPIRLLDACWRLKRAIEEQGRGAEFVAPPVNAGGPGVALYYPGVTADQVIHYVDQILRPAAREARRKGSRVFFV